jgi:hypothetical protein
MQSVREIQDAIKKLNPDELRALWKWLEDYADQRWDGQIEQDALAGRLDETAAAALREHHAGRTTPA